MLLVLPQRLAAPHVISSVVACGRACPFVSHASRRCILSLTHTRTHGVSLSSALQGARGTTMKG